MTLHFAQELQERVRAAYVTGQPLQIVGGGSKRFYGRNPVGTELPVTGLSGIIDYAPSELVITAWAGTQLAQIEQVLAAENQFLGFEPPRFAPEATLGGTVACGLSGPRRPYQGSVRDFVLGLSCLTGTGDILRFGGRVMKNVAGYDVSRLMTGSLGTLGVLLEISLKLLPQPEREITLVQEATVPAAMSRLAQWGREPLPLSGAAFDGTRLWLRLSGAGVSVDCARARMGGEVEHDGAAFWVGLRELTLPFFADGKPLWRISVAPATPPLDLPGRCLYDWGGAQRWVVTDAPAETVREASSAAGGHATVFRGQNGAVFQPLPATLMSLHKRLKDAFDPRGIMNPRRLYPDW